MSQQSTRDLGSGHYKEMREYRKRLQEQEEEYHNAILETRDMIKNLIEYHKERDKLILDTLRGLVQ